MRLSLSLLALAATLPAWVATASAQTPPADAPQAQVLLAPVAVQPAPVAVQPAPVAVQPVPAQPYAVPPVFVPAAPPPAPYAVYGSPVPPTVTAPLPSSAVLLLPQDLLLAGKGSWERRGNELFLRHSGTAGSRRSGLIAGGIVLLSVGYTPALIMGGLMSVLDGPSGIGTSLFLPVAGPFLSGLCALSRCDNNFLGSSGGQVWAWTWMLVDGSAQIAGLAMIIAGARSRSGSGQSFLERVHILPYSTQSGGGVTVSGRF